MEDEIKAAVAKGFAILGENHTNAEARRTIARLIDQGVIKWLLIEATVFGDYGPKATAAVLDGGTPPDASLITVTGIGAKNPGGMQEILDAAVRKKIRFVIADKSVTGDPTTADNMRQRDECMAQHAREAKAAERHDPMGGALLCGFDHAEAISKLLEFTSVVVDIRDKA